MAMNNATTNHPTEAVEAYAHRLLREVVRLLGRRRPGADIDDIASMVVEKFLRRSEQIMAQYPDPARFARAAAHHTGIAFDRRQRVQRGEGSRLVAQTDGTLRPGRRYISGNVAFGDDGPELFTTAHDSAEPVEVQVEHSLDHHALLEQCFVGVPAADRQLLLLVDGMGYTVSELATTAGRRRETLSRRISRVRRLVHHNHAGLAVAASSSGSAR